MTARKDFLTEVETKTQERWELERPYDLDAPTDGSNPPKYFITFPYPYMNGKLHLGHGFSITKSEFAARYWRLKGRRVLWPFGLHVTGTPIAACAQKIQKEIRLYGNPPQFPAEVLEGPKEEKPAAPGQFKAKRVKVGPAKPQWQIMQGMGIPDDEIPAFGDARHWLNYFPSKALTDLKRMGCHIDQRRSFITTDVNPFYDSFIRWQFNNLHASGKLKWGKRYSIYSPLDGQPCADHDRASGEGVGPQEYCVVKLIVNKPEEHDAFKAHTDKINGMDVILPGATLRAETVVGQTNCWVSPTVTYRAYTVQPAEGEGKPQIFVMTSKAARNMAYQGFKVGGVVDSDPEPLFEVEGKHMIGLPIKAPHAPYEFIYSLPMDTITENKGTGIVMSVPSDSPDDYTNFMQLVKKPDYRAKLGLKDEWVVPFDIKSIIECEGDLGTEAARIACEKFKVQGPKDADKLTEAKALAYQDGFYKGKMTVGPFAGEKVMHAKMKMQQVMVDNYEAIRYQEPTKEVMSRSGDVCVVALCDQWYIEYGQEEWKEMVSKHVKNNMELYFPGIRNAFDDALDWLSEWPCSRTFGLGTYLPCDASKTMIVDSLSDSTIYMAYYTVAHFFHSAEDGTLSLDASKANKYGVKPEMINDKFWDFVMRGKGTAAECNSETGIPLDLVEKMRTELTYWYPVDLRVSGKDLVQNHLTMFLYNHAAIWPGDEKMWPRSIYCNGHVQVDGQKMSKSLGNFITLKDAMETFTADCTRLACADAGDSMEDANFVKDTANGFILKLTTLIDQAKEAVTKQDAGRKGEYNLFDRIFENAMNHIIVKTDGFYSQMAFRMVLSTAYHQLTAERNQYELMCGTQGMHADLQVRFVEVIALLLMPLAPHTCEYLWTEVLNNKNSIMSAAFPEPSAPVNFGLLMSARLLNDTAHDIRTQAQKLAKKRGPFSEVHIYSRPVFSEWQVGGLSALQRIYDENNSSFPADTTKQIMGLKEKWLQDNKKNMQEVMGFIAFAKGNCEKYGVEALATTPTYNDNAVLDEAKAFLASSTSIPEIILHNFDDETIADHKNARAKCRPGEPTVAFPPAAAGDAAKPKPKHADPSPKKE